MFLEVIDESRNLGVCGNHMDLNLIIIKNLFSIFHVHTIKWVLENLGISDEEMLEEFGDDVVSLISSLESHVNEGNTCVC